MRTPALLPLLAACTLAPGGPGGALDGLDAPIAPGVAAVRLHAGPGAPTLAAVGAADAGTTRATIAAWQAADDAAGAGAWQAPLPDAFLSWDRRFAPPHLRLEADGAALPYRFHDAAPSWRLDDRTVRVWWPGDAPPPPLTLRGAGAAVGAAPTRAVRTIDGAHRAGLLVPGGGAVEARVPRGGTLRATVAAAAGRPEAVEVEASGQRWSFPVPADGAAAIVADLPAGPLVIRARGGASDAVFLAHPTVHPPAGPAPRRILWIGLDTTRPDHLGAWGHARPTSPNLDALAARSFVFDAAVAPAPRTRPSFRAALTGRRPLDAVGAPGAFAALSDAGFATAGVVANPHLDPALGFGTGADLWRVAPEARAAEQVDVALGWLTAHQHHDAALFLHFMDPHLPYDAPAPHFEAFADDGPTTLPDRLPRREIVRRMAEGALPARDKERLIARYDGEIRYLDGELGRLLDAVARLPGRTLVVVHSDHGEELWDRGGFEHNHSLAPEVVDAVLLVHLPGQREGARIATPVSLEDVAPTVLDLLGLPAPGATGRSLRPLLRGEALPEVPRGVAHLMYDAERWGVRARGHTYILHTGSGREELYDRRVDPDERDDLVARGVDPAPFRAALAEAHGADVGPGWRLAVTLDGPVTLALPAPARAAGVIDPEALRRGRANRVWGERPPVAPDDVARVRLDDGGRTLHLTPGAHGEGMVWIRFETEVAVGGVARSGDVSAPLGADVALPAGRLEVTAGTVIVPPLGEAERLWAIHAPATAPDAHRDALRALGYLADPED